MYTLNIELLNQKVRDIPIQSLLYSVIEYSLILALFT